MFTLNTQLLFSNICYMGQKESISQGSASLWLFFKKVFPSVLSLKVPITFIKHELAVIFPIYFTSWIGLNCFCWLNMKLDISSIKINNVKGKELVQCNIAYQTPAVFIVNCVMKLILKLLSFGYINGQNHCEHLLCNVAVFTLWKYSW